MGVVPSWRFSKGSSGRSRPFLSLLIRRRSSTQLNCTRTEAGRLEGDGEADEAR